MDALRILCAFLVIVNHTNSRVFQQYSLPGQPVWWLSILWYYFSKTAVPVYVMISGACLLGRQEGWRRALQRFGRILAALVVFSYFYFLHDCWVNYGLWPRMLRLDLLVEQIWSQQVTDGFWYLYFYLGLMLMLPLFQRMAQGMKDRDYGWALGLCLGLDCVLPLLCHYLPDLTPPGDLQAPLYTAYFGLFLAGYWIRTRLRVTPKVRRAAWTTLALCLAVSAVLTYLESMHMPYYWFMDNRMHPSLFTCVSSLCIMALAKGKKPAEKADRVWRQLGSCAFGIYLLQDWLIAQTETRLFAPLADAIGAMPAVLLWEVLVFALALAAAWVMRRIPLLRRIV